jgi:hypothetical protein
VVSALHRCGGFDTVGAGGASLLNHRMTSVVEVSVVETPEPWEEQCVASTVTSL